MDEDAIREVLIEMNKDAIRKILEKYLTPRFDGAKVVLEITNVESYEGLILELAEL